MIVKINGQPFDLTSMEIEGEFAKLPVKPPVEDTPPVRPTEPKPDQTKTLGALTKSIPLIWEHMEEDKVYSYDFWVPEDVDVPMIVFGMTPQSSELTGFTVWFSKTPGGSPIDDRYGSREGFARRGDQMQLIAAVRGKGAERRGMPINAGEVYYFNMLADRDHVMRWRIAGAFPR